MQCLKVGIDVGLHMGANVEHEVGDADGPATVVGADGVHRRHVNRRVGVHVEPML